MLLLFPLLRSGGRPRALPFEFCGVLGALAPFRCTGLLCLLRGFAGGGDLWAPPRCCCTEDEEDRELEDAAGVGARGILLLRFLPPGFKCRVATVVWGVEAPAVFVEALAGVRALGSAATRSAWSRTTRALTI